MSLPLRRRSLDLIERGPRPARVPLRQSVGASQAPALVIGPSGPMLRIDAEVAVRMHLTGHTRSEIVRTIKDAALSYPPRREAQLEHLRRAHGGLCLRGPGSRRVDQFRGQQEKLARLRT